MSTVGRYPNRTLGQALDPNLSPEPSPFPNPNAGPSPNPKPHQVCKEVARVLRPGGVAMFALSNRCFPTKAVNVWLKTNDLEHVYLVGKSVSL